MKEEHVDLKGRGPPFLREGLRPERFSGRVR